MTGSFIASLYQIRWTEGTADSELKAVEDFEVSLSIYSKKSQIILDNKNGKVFFCRKNNRPWETFPFINHMVTLRTDIFTSDIFKEFFEPFIVNWGDLGQG